MRIITRLLMATIIHFATSAYCFVPSTTSKRHSSSAMTLHSHNHSHNQSPSDKAAGSLLAFAALLTFNTAVFMTPSVASADSSRLVGSISGSGIVFKDTLNIESFDDPKVKGVTLYISNFQRPITERLQKDFFSDPSFASVGCAKTASTIKIADNINMTPNGEEVFEESRSLLFKTLRVQRVYDKEKNTMVYVSFNTRLDKNSDTNKSRFKSSICAVNLD